MFYLTVQSEKDVLDNIKQERYELRATKPYVKHTA